jgi:hypothetical protein
VTGAPGAGKSTVLAELLGRRTGYLFFDVDWLAGAGSRLSGRSIYEDASTWPAYRALWLEVLAGVARNGRQPVWFGPWNAADLAEAGATDGWRVVGGERQPLRLQRLAQRLHRAGPHPMEVRNPRFGDFRQLAEPRDPGPRQRPPRRCHQLRKVVLRPRIAHGHSCPQKPRQPPGSGAAGRSAVDPPRLGRRTLTARGLSFDPWPAPPPKRYY